MENKDNTIKLINAILNKVWSNKFDEDCGIWVTDINSDSLSITWEYGNDEWIEKAGDLAILELFDICDDIRSTPFYGSMILPNKIEKIETPIQYVYREDYTVTKEMLEEVLNDPIFDDII